LDGALGGGTSLSGEREVLTCVWGGTWQAGAARRGATRRQRDARQNLRQPKAGGRGAATELEGADARASAQRFGGETDARRHSEKTHGRSRGERLLREAREVDEHAVQREATTGDEEPDAEQHATATGDEEPRAEQHGTATGDEGSSTRPPGPRSRSRRTFTEEMSMKKNPAEAELRLLHIAPRWAPTVVDM
jgi:hypothetical protein